MDYRSTIDDEFASLFLQELQGSRAFVTPSETGDKLPHEELSSSNVSSTNAHEIISSGTATAIAEDNRRNTGVDQGNNTGAASYARYLPLETTYSSGNLFDFNYLDQGTDTDLLAGIMNGATVMHMNNMLTGGSMNVQFNNSPNNIGTPPSSTSMNKNNSNGIISNLNVNYMGINDAMDIGSYGMSMDSGIEIGSRSNSSMTKLKQELDESIPITNAPSQLRNERNDNNNTLLSIDTPQPLVIDFSKAKKIDEKDAHDDSQPSTTNTHPDLNNAPAETAKKDTIEPSLVPQSLQEGKNSGDNGEHENPEKIIEMCDALLSFTRVDVNVATNANESFLKTNINGRVFISSETVDDFKKNGKLSDVFELSKIFCYRRNALSMDMILDFDKIFASIVPKGHALENMKLNLFSSLRKVNNLADVPNLEDCTVLTDYDEFVFPAKTPSNKRDSIMVRKSQTAFTIHELQELWTKHGKTLCFSWEQIKFKTATANNMHDFGTKYYIICFQIELFIKNQTTNEVQMRKISYESHPYNVRGRNPRFYSDRLDVLISQLRDMSKKEISKREQSIKEKEKEIEEEEKEKDQAQDQKKEKGKDKNKDDETFPTLPSLSARIQQQPPTLTTTEKSDVQETPVERQRTESVASEGSEVSSYQYFPVDGPYYHAPVEVGYFPHHVHHNKQVFVPTPALTPQKPYRPRQRQIAVLRGPAHRQYNYFI